MFRDISEAYQVLSDPDKRYKYDHPEEDRFKFNFRDEHKLFKDFYRKGTFDENKDFNNFKSRWLDDDKFFKNVPEHESFNQNYAKEESTETVEENGVRKTIYRSKITHPDGQVQEIERETIDDGYGIPQTREILNKSYHDPKYIMH